MEFLYRYQPFQKFYESICHEALTFSDPASLNDPFDCRTLVSSDSTKEERERFLKNLKENPSSESEHKREEFIESVDKDLNSGFHHKKLEFHSHYIDRLEEILKNHAKKTLGILCLSEYRDHILMWSHYAEYHKGICIEFRKDALESNFKYCKPINYRKELPSLGEYLDSSQEGQVKLFLMRKFKHWEYEQEWRVIRRFNDLNETSKRNIELPKGLISGIILGCEIPDENKEKIKKVLQKKNQGIQLYQAEKSRSKYSLEINRI